MPLHWVCFQCHEVVATMLLDKGADVRAKNSNGLTPLYKAYKQKACVDICMALLETDVYAKNDAGDTPLLFACDEGHAEVAMALLEGREGRGCERIGNCGICPVQGFFLWTYRGGRRAAGGSYRGGHGAAGDGHGRARQEQ